MENETKMLKIWIDTDVDIDDWMAMLFLLNHPDVEVLGISVVGTGAAHIEPGTRNALALMQLAGKPDTPVARGLATPMRYDHQFPADIRNPVDDLFGITLPPNPNPAHSDAIAYLSQMLETAAEPVSILAIGPLTNLGTLLEQSPKLAKKIDRIFIMGGAIEVPGNVHSADPSIDNIVAEWNIYNDPVAADIVLRSGAPITMIPLDATRNAPITEAFYNRLLLDHKTPSADFIFQALGKDFGFLASGNFDFWDPMAAALATEGDLGAWREVKLRVDTTDTNLSGELVVDEAGSSVRAFDTVDAFAFEDRFLEVLNGEKSPRGSVTFLLDGELVSLNDVHPRDLLIDYLHCRDADKHGTKLVCGEGGCGACTVMLTHFDIAEQKIVKRAVNACLRPLCSIDGTMVTTTQGIGDVNSAVDEVQFKIAANNGSQCGFCTPGFTMNMFTLLQNKKELSEAEIEAQFDGNICRCTGYRPILEGFKQFARDYTPPHPDAAIVFDPKYCPKEKPSPDIQPPADFLPYMKNPQPLQFSADGYTYARPVTMKALHSLKASNGPTGSTFRLVCGNTSIGIYKTRPLYAEKPLDPTYLVDVSAIPELRDVSIDDEGLTVGAATTINQLIVIAGKVIAERNPPTTEGLRALVAHLKIIANQQVRSVASIAGNLHMAANLGFLSDLVIALAPLGATLTISSSAGDQVCPVLKIPREQQLPRDAIYRSIRIPFTNEGEYVRTYKIRRRQEDSHAIVNAGFKVRFGAGGTVSNCVFVFNGLDGDYAPGSDLHGIPFTPIIVPKTRAFLKGKPWDEGTLRGALDILRQETGAYKPPLAPSGAPLELNQIPWSYRLSLAENLFYKFFVSVALSVDPNIVNPAMRSAGITEPRPVSHGQQSYNSYPDELPVSAPMIKLSAFTQATGQAVYTHSVPAPENTVEAAFVYSLVARGTFSYQFPISTSHGVKGAKASIEELQSFLADWSPDLLSFITYEDIALENRMGNWVGFGGDDPIFVPVDDAEIPPSVLGNKSPVFEPGQISCLGAPIGLIIAKNRRAAQDIADFVRTQCIKFNGLEPSLDLDRAIANKDFFPEGPATSAIATHIKEITRPGSDAGWLDEPTQPLRNGGDEYPVVSGVQKTGYQNHFYLETMATLAIPGENQVMTLYTSTQTLADNQYTAAGLLGLSANDVRVVVIRDGGAFGGRQTRSRFNSTAAALAAQKLGRPVRLVMDRNTNFIMCGERHPFEGRYHVAYGDDGTLKGWHVDYYANGGNTYDVSFPVMDLAQLCGDNAYQVDTYRTSGQVARTNHLSNTAFRSFGLVQSINIVEMAVERVAYALGITPEEVREKNLYRDGTPEVTGFEITKQALGVLLGDGWNEGLLSALESISGKVFGDLVEFKAGVRAATGSDLSQQEWVTLEEFSSNSWDFTPYMQALQFCNIQAVWKQLLQSSDIDARREDIRKFNAGNRWKKRGISAIPLKYGISYTGPRGTLNQGGAYVVAYARDGSIIVNHGGVESGQGIQTKMAQIAAETLDIPIELIRIGTTDTEIISDASSTAASTGSDLNGGAVQEACLKLRHRLEKFCEDLEQYTVYFSKFDPAKMDEEQKQTIETVTRNWRDRWSEVWPLVCSLAYVNRIDLTAEARYKTPHYSGVDNLHPHGRPFFYFTYAAAASEVEIDTLTGEYTILRSDILFDLGKSLNPLIDVGQIEGGFVQGLGYLTMEEMLFQGPSQIPHPGYPDGAITSFGTWDYKPPGASSIPLDFRVSIVDNAGQTLNQDGPKLDAAAVKSSKGIGEPPLVLANTVFFAIRQAIQSFHEQEGHGEFVPLDAPATIQNIQSACQVAINDLRL